MATDFDLSPRLQTLASSLLEQALNGEQTTAPRVSVFRKRKKRAYCRDGDWNPSSPFAIAAREIAAESGVNPALWLNRRHPLNDQLYERMRELAGVPLNADPRRRPSNQRSIYV